MELKISIHSVRPTKQGNMIIKYPIHVCASSAAFEARDNRTIGEVFDWHIIPSIMVKYKTRASKHQVLTNGNILLVGNNLDDITVPG